MPRLIGPAFAAALMSTGAPAAAEITVTSDPACRVVRILPSGKRIVKPATQRHRGRDSAHSASASSSSGSSAVSVSSHSSGSGYASSSASSTSGRGGRTVTTTHDDNGCTIVIDDRARRGARR